jgi:hypothetical protein
MIPTPDRRGSWRSWRLGGGVSLRISSWGLRALDVPISDERGTRCVHIFRPQAAAVLAALGRERSQPK